MPGTDRPRGGCERRSAKKCSPASAPTSIPTGYRCTMLGVAHQQIVEIAKALSQDARILVHGRADLSAVRARDRAAVPVIDACKRQGVAIVYISPPSCRGVPARRPHHRTARRPQSRELAARRDHAGRAGELMVGRARWTRTYAPPVLRVDARRSRARGPRRQPQPTASSDVSDLQVVRAGEIVGLSGLVGSGRSEVARAIFGADPSHRAGRDHGSTAS